MNPRLIILTGWACPADWLRPLARAVGRGADLEIHAVLNLRPVGPAPAGMSRYAAGLLDLLASGPAGARVVGWSMGGLVALEACQARPDLFGGLALLGATARFTRADGYEAGAREAGVRALARRLAREPLPTMARWLKEGARFPAMSEPESIRMAEEVLRSFAAPALLEGLDYLLRADWRPGLSRLRTPALVVHARGDALVPAAAAESLAAAMPAAQLKVVEQADHFLPVRRPADVAAEIRGFFRGLA